MACFEDGTKFLKAVNRSHLEGIVSKRKASPYRSGQSRDWRKIKATACREATGGGSAVTAILIAIDFSPGGFAVDRPLRVVLSTCRNADCQHRAPVALTPRIIRKR